MAIQVRIKDDELMHYGVKGMQWGKRTVRKTHYDTGSNYIKDERAAYKQFKKDNEAKKNVARGHKNSSAKKRKQAAIIGKERVLSVLKKRV